MTRQLHYLPRRIVIEDYNFGGGRCCFCFCRHFNYLDIYVIYDCIFEFFKINLVIDNFEISHSDYD